MSTQIQFDYATLNRVVGWWGRQRTNPLTFIAPVVSSVTGGTMGNYKYFPQGYVFRRANTSRALYTAANTVDVNAVDKPFLLRDHALRIGVDDQEILNETGINLARIQDDAERAAVRRDKADLISASKTGTLLETWKTSFIADGFDFYRKEIAATAANWTNGDAKPTDSIRSAILKFAAQNGVYPNRYLWGLQGWNTYAANPDTKDLIEYNDAKILTEDLFKKLISIPGMDMSAIQVMCSLAPMGQANPAPDVAFDGADIVGNELWMTYVDAGTTINDISGLKTVSTVGEDMFEAVESYYNRDIKTTWYECACNYDHIVTAPTCVARYAIS